MRKTIATITIELFEENGHSSIGMEVDMGKHRSASPLELGGVLESAKIQILTYDLPEVLIH
jgi:hypothetical protein